MIYTDDLLWIWEADMAYRLNPIRFTGGRGCWLSGLLSRLDHENLIF